MIGSAAAIMVAVFASFIINGDPTVKEFGVGLASAILIAGSMVCVLLPAVMLLMGRRTWWLPHRWTASCPTSAQASTRLAFPLSLTPPNPNPTRRSPHVRCHTRPAAIPSVQLPPPPAGSPAARPLAAGLVALPSPSGPRRRPTRPTTTASASARRSPSSTTPRPRPRSTPRSPTLHDAAATTAGHAGDAVSDQVADQEDALHAPPRASPASVTAGDAFEFDVYQAELNVAVDDLAGNADDFRTTGPEVQQAFWDGYDTGLPADPSTTTPRGDEHVA